MKVRDLMTDRVIRVRADEPVAVAARTLAHYNVGALPVMGNDGAVCGMVTDRDLVTRCVAAGRNPNATTIREIMTNHVVSVGPEQDAATAAAQMAREQVRRLPVMEHGKLCGMVSLGDLACSPACNPDAADAFAEITGNVSHR